MNSRLADPGVVLGAQTPRICLVPPADVSATGEMALEVCERAGLFLDPWQRFVLTSSLAERADGRFAAFEVAEVVPRQNGKGSTLEGRELTGMFAIDEERLIIHSAHEQATSSEHFRRLLELIESVPEFDQRVLRAPKGKGMEAIELRDGSRVLFKTRTGGGGRGLTGDLVVLDEAMILPDATIAALVPTMAARSIHGNPQLWYAGSAVDQEKTEHGVVLTRVRERGIKGAPGLMYVEWSAEGDDPSSVPAEVRTDPEVWAQANPGMGIRISQEHIANEAGGALGPREFAVERLGIGDWPDTSEDGNRKISRAAWAKCLDSELQSPLDPVCLVFDVSPNRSSSTIAAAGLRADGLWGAEVIEHGPGTGWVVDSVAALGKARKPAAILYDGAGPAASLLAELEQAKVRKLTPVTAAQLAQACGAFHDVVADNTFRHIGQPELDDAIDGAGTRPLVDAWAWSRRVSTADISPLVACTIAVWAAQARRTRRGGVVNLAAALAAAQQS